MRTIPIPFPGAVALLCLLALGCPAPRPERRAPPQSGPAAASRSAASRTGSPTDRCDGRPCIQVGTFNAFWLGSKRRWDLPLRDAGEVRRIAAWLADDLDLEVIALEEVNTSVHGLEEGELTFAPDRYRWLREALAERGYRLMAGESGNAQRVVLAYDADEVELLSPARELETESFFDFGEECRSAVRRPLAARLRAGSFDFWIVAVHLKSRREGECSDLIRRRQVEQMGLAIDRLLEGDGEGDVILSGDFNALPDDPTTAALRSPGGFVELTRRDRRAPGSGTVSYLIGEYASLIDHLMIRPATMAEWIAGSTVIYDPGRPSEESFHDYTSVFSDHAAVWTSFATDRDDD